MLRCFPIRYTSAVLFVALAACVQSYPFPLIEDASTPVPTPSQHRSIQSIRPETCGFQGNNDIYGPGIRIGIYTQTLAVFFSKYFLLSQAHVLRDSITVFSIALFSVALLFAATADSQYSVEFFIILQVLSWSCLTGVRAKTSYAKEMFRSKESIIRLVLTESLNVGSLSLHVWFWFTGIDKTQKTNCGTFVFFIVRVEMYGWFRTIMKVFSVLGIADHVYDGFLESVQAWTLGMVRRKKEDFANVIAGFQESERIGPEGPHFTISTVMQREDVVQSPTPSQKSSRSNQNSLVGTRPSFDRQRTLVNPPQLRTPRSSSLHESIELTRISTQTSFEDSESHHPVSPQSLKPPSNRPQSHQYQTFTHPLLVDIHANELWLERCLSVGTASRLTYSNTIFYKLLMRLLLVPRLPLGPTEETLVATDSTLPSYRSCSLHILKGLLTFHFPQRAIVVYTHILRSKVLNPWDLPYQLYTALKWPSPSSTPPSTGAIAIASSLLLARTPKLARNLAWTSAGIDMVIHVMVILQLELTIRWNRIEGLSGLGSVGQLIPFVIGIGGLGLVLGRWIEEFWMKKAVVRKYDDSEEVRRHLGVDGLDIGVVEGYERWKKGFEERLEREARSG